MSEYCLDLFVWRVSCEPHWKFFIKFLFFVVIFTEFKCKPRQHNALNTDVFSIPLLFDELYRLQWTWALASHIVRFFFYSAVTVTKGQWTIHSECELIYFEIIRQWKLWNINRYFWTDVISICHLSLHLATVKVRIINIITKMAKSMLLDIFHQKKNCSKFSLTQHDCVEILMYKKFHLHCYGLYYIEH